MAAAETARLIASLELKDNMSKGIASATASIGKLDTRLGKVGQGFKTLGSGIGVALRNGALLAGVALGGLVALIGKSIKEGQEAAKVQTIYANAIQNSGRVTTQYVKVLNAQQTALMNLAGVDDEVIKAEQTKLIQMGLTGDQVAKLTPLILDMSKATGKDLVVSTLAAGKAANGSATSLQRFGVFVDKAKFKVDPFAATMEALNKKFGGTTQALSTSLEARLGAFRANMANIREELGIKLLPALTRIVDVAGKDLVPAFGKFIDRILPSLVSGIDKFASMLENGGAERGIKAISDALGPMVELLKLAAAPVKAIVSAFLSLPSQVQGILIGGFAINKLSGGLIGQGLGQVASGVFQRGGSPATPLYVSDVAKGLGGAAAAGGGLGLASKVFLIGEAIGLGILVNEVRQNMADQNTAKSQEIAGTLGKFLAQSPSQADLRSALDGIDQGIHDIEANPLNVLVQGEALDNLRKMRADVAAQLQKLSPGLFGLGAVAPALLHALARPGISADARSAAMRGIVTRASAAGFNPTQAAVTATYERNVARAAAAQKAATDRVRDEAARTTAAALATAAAVRDKDSSPQVTTNVTVNVTAAQVEKSVVIQNRFGPANGSRGGGHAPGTGPLP